MHFIFILNTCTQSNETESLLILECYKNHSQFWVEVKIVLIGPTADFMAMRDSSSCISWGQGFIFIHNTAPCSLQTNKGYKPCLSPAASAGPFLTRHRSVDSPQTAANLWLVRKKTANICLCTDCCASRAYKGTATQCESSIERHMVVRVLELWVIGVYIRRDLKV